MYPGEISEPGAKGVIWRMIWWAMGSRAPSVTGEMWWADFQICHLWASLLAVSCIKNHTRSVYMSAQLYLLPMNNILYWCSSWVMSWVWICSTLETKQKCYEGRDPVLWQNKAVKALSNILLLSWKPIFIGYSSDIKKKVEERFTNTLAYSRND